LQQLLQGFSNTGTRASISSYNAIAKTHLEFTEINDETLMSGGLFDTALGNPGDDVNGLPAVNTGYVLHGTTPELIDPLLGGGTNWEAGLLELRDTIAPNGVLASRPDVPLIVLHITDGNPNEYVDENGDFIFDPDGTLPLDQAVEVADDIKQNLGTHIYTIGIGSVADNPEELIALAGPDIFDADDPEDYLNIITDDLLIANDLNKIVAPLTTFASASCAPQLIVRQWIETSTGSGDYETVHGWDFNATPWINAGKSGNPNYEWHMPTSYSSVATDADGYSRFQWSVHNEQAWNNSRVTVNSLDLGDTYTMRGVTCRSNLGRLADEEIDANFMQSEGRFSVNLQNYEIMTCDVYNTLQSGKAKSQIAQLAIEQHADTYRYSCPGDKIEYTYDVTNVGGAPLSNLINISDTTVNGISCPQEFTGKETGVLSVGESVQCTGQYVVTQEDVDRGYLANAAWAYAGQTVSATGEMRISYTPYRDPSAKASSKAKSEKSAKADACPVITTTADSVEGSTTAEETMTSDSETAVDSTSDRSIAAEPTRTAKWFRSRPAYIQSCVNALGGDINVGMLTIRDEAYDDEIDTDSDTTAESAIELAAGLFNAKAGRDSTGKRRGRVTSRCIQASRELLTAQCNSAVFGTAPTFDLDQSVAATEQACQSTGQRTTKLKKLKRIQKRARKFNRSGRAADLPSLDVESTEIGIRADDPTDSND